MQGINKLCFFLFLLVSITENKCLAQNRLVIDSLGTALAASESDSVKAGVLLRLAYEWRNNDPEKAIGYCKQACELSGHTDAKIIGRANVLMGIAESNLGNYTEALQYLSDALKGGEKNQSIISAACNNMGSVYAIMGRYNDAMKSYEAVLAIQKEINDNKETADCLSNIADIFERRGEYKQAIKRQQDALQIRQQIGDLAGIAKSYNYSGIVCRRSGDYAEAMQNHLAALKILEASGDIPGAAYAYLNIGVVYNYLDNYPEALKNCLTALKMYKASKNKRGIAWSYEQTAWVYGNQKKFDEALKNYSAALAIAKEIGDAENTGLNYNNIGFVYKTQRNFPLAIHNLQEAIKITEAIGDTANMAETYESLGETYEDMGKYNEAILWLNNAVKVANTIGEKSILKECFLGLSAVYGKQKNYEEAYRYHKLYTEADQSLADESLWKIAEMKTNYETEKREDKILILNKDKEIQTKEIRWQKLMSKGLMAGFLVVLFFAGVVLYQRNRIIKEKSRSEELLLNILPSEVAAELKEKGRADARLFDNVTVLFTDFKSFTTVSERLTPQQLVDELDTCFSAFDNIISKYNIEKIKTVGDAYLAAAGLPSPNPSHAEDLIYAAIEMRNFIVTRYQRLGDKTFEVRIGIHSGPVVAGIVGIKKFAYDIWGDTVNIAARMEQNSEAGKINISQTTYELVKDKFKCEYRGEIEAKNKGLLKMYFVTNS